jgi:hypothetical protein
MKTCYSALTVLLLSLCLNASAGDIKVKVEKKLILVSPGSSAGSVTVAGQPGAVFGVQPVQIIAVNDKTDLSVAGTVNDDGSFALEIPARPKDSIKLSFIAANNEDKKVKVKVPKTMLYLPASQEIKTETTTVTIPGAPQQHELDDTVIRQERDLKNSGITE